MIPCATNEKQIIFIQTKTKDCFKVLILHFPHKNSDEYK